MSSFMVDIVKSFIVNIINSFMVDIKYDCSETDFVKDSAISFKVDKIAINILYSVICFMKNFKVGIMYNSNSLNCS
jgi:hypothetical protein